MSIPVGSGNCVSIGNVCRVIGATVSITLLCPRLKCRAILRVPESARGKQVRCADCGAAFLVPEAEKPDAQRKKPAEPKPSE